MGSRRRRVNYFFMKYLGVGVDGNIYDASERAWDVSGRVMLVSRSNSHLCSPRISSRRRRDTTAPRSVPGSAAAPLNGAPPTPSGFSAKAV